MAGLVLVEDTPEAMVVDMEAESVDIVPGWVAIVVGWVLAQGTAGGAFMVHRPMVVEPSERPGDAAKMLMVLIFSCNCAAPQTANSPVYYTLVRCTAVL